MLLRLPALPLLAAALVLLLVAQWACLAVVKAAPLSTRDALLTLDFYPPLLAELGVRITTTTTGLSAPNPPKHSNDGYVRLQLRTQQNPVNALQFDAPNGVYSALSGGQLRFQEVVSIDWDGTPVTLSNATLRPDNGRALRLYDGADDNSAALFIIDYLHPRLDLDSDRLTIRHAELRLAPQLAARLHRPELAGIALGRAEIDAVLDQNQAIAARRSFGQITAGSDFPSCAGRQPNYRVNYNDDPNDDLAVDIMLTAIDRVGCRSCAGERVNIVPSVRLANIGSADIPWFWRLTGPTATTPINGVDTLADFLRYGGFIADGGWVPDYDRQHPYLVWALYRRDNNGLTMLGRSALKHAFNAVNDNCPCDQGKVFWAGGCSDLYGQNTNASIQHLAPRAEVEAHSGLWQYQQSNFDPNDDLLFDHDQVPDGVAEVDYEQLSVTTTELQRPGDYFLEAWYVIGGDRNLYNSLGFVQLAPQINNGLWTFPLLGGLFNGPLLNAWIDPQKPAAGEQHSVLCPDDSALTHCSGSSGNVGVGHLQLAVKTESLGGGRYRYHYALLNLDHDPQIREFSLPVPADVTITEIQFRNADADADATAANDWLFSRDDNVLRWSAPDAQAALDWGTLIGISLSADASPGDAEAELVNLEHMVTLRAATLAPGARGLLSDGFESPSP